LLLPQESTSKSTYCESTSSPYCESIYSTFFPSWPNSHWRGQCLLIVEAPRSSSDTHNLQDSSGRAIDLTQRPLPDNTQHSQKTDIHAPGGIPTRILRERAALFTPLTSRQLGSAFSKLNTKSKYML